MLSREENELLTRIGPGTPAGELLRRYWHVVAAAAELSEENPKKKVTILGEKLVLFRDRKGNYGLIAEKCSHRGVSLYYGFVEEDGIRCAYHGWKYDACGKCIDQPFESPEAGFKQKIQHTAYPVVKRAGAETAPTQVGRFGARGRHKKNRRLRSPVLQLVAGNGKLRRSYTYLLSPFSYPQIEGQSGPCAISLPRAKQNRF